MISSYFLTNFICQFQYMIDHKMFRNVTDSNDRDLRSSHDVNAVDRFQFLDDVARCLDDTSRINQRNIFYSCILQLDELGTNAMI